MVVVVVVVMVMAMATVVMVPAALDRCQHRPLLRKAHRGSRLLAPLSDAKKLCDVECTASPFCIKARYVIEAVVGWHVHGPVCLHVCLRALPLAATSASVVSLCLMLSRAVPCSPQ